MIFQAVVSVLLIVIVLLQFGKGAEAGLMSGGGGESLMTGAQQGNILSKATVVLSILFMGNSVLLAKIQSEKAGSSLLDNEAPVARPLNSDAQTETAAPTTAPQAEKKMEEKANTEEKK
jgi:preprotein translocase subunit SecG